MLVLTAANLRGVRESGTAFAVPTYAFMVAILGMAAVGLRPLTSRRPAGRGERAASTWWPRTEYDDGLTGLAGAFLLLRAFSSGCAALTGVEAISNGVPAFRKPKRKNAATTLLLLGTIAVTMLLSIIVLAKTMGLRVRRGPRRTAAAGRRARRAVRSGGVRFPDGTTTSRTR